MPPSFVYPDWLPPAVCQQAKNIYEIVIKEDDADAITLLRRLTSDPRMEKVWQEIFKKKRIAGRNIEEFHHPATFSFTSRAKSMRLRASDLRKKSGDVNEAEARLLETEAAAIEHHPEPQIYSPQTEQDLTVGYFFHHAYYYARHAPIISISEINTSIETFLTTARTLRGEVKKLRSFGMDNDALHLEHIASACEEKTSWIERDDDDPWIVDRHRTDKRLRGYVTWLGMTSRELFGTPLYGTLATITNVALDRNDITGARISEMLRAKRDSGV